VLSGAFPRSGVHFWEKLHSSAFRGWYVADF
jgi:hypothetical protein